MNGSQQFASLDGTVLPPRPLHLAIGMFDGVHLGHRAVIDAAIQSAQRSVGIAGVLTFWPHPSALFRPDNATRLITPPAIKSRLLADAGVDVVIAQEFTPEFAKIEAEAFLPHLKQRLPKLSSIYVGENWRFGRGRRGDVKLLIAEARKHDIAVISAQRINRDGEPISSTRIRGCLEAGQIEDANALLGYTYFAEGTMTAGKRLGRQIGFPTLNIAWEPELRPQFGVYAVEVTGAKSTDRHAGVANYGLRPTVEQGAAQPRLEVHLLGACPFDAGDAIRVEWLRFLRPEKRFGNVDELKSQIANDRDATAAFFAAREQ